MAFLFFLPWNEVSSKIPKLHLAPSKEPRHEFLLRRGTCIKSCTIKASSTRLVQLRRSEANNAVNGSGRCNEPDEPCSKSMSSSPKTKLGTSTGINLVIICWEIFQVYSKQTTSTHTNDIVSGDSDGIAGKYE